MIKLMNIPFGIRIQDLHFEQENGSEEACVHMQMHACILKVSVLTPVSLQGVVLKHIQRPLYKYSQLKAFSCAKISYYANL